MNSATYCPEDNKLRLYVGRVPRPEYETLRAEGWTSTPKQDCDFVAVWTPERRARAESHAQDGIIDDEDKGPDERAADRAERFTIYREKREGEATGHADRFDAGPHVHGFQNAGKAFRSADRHDKIAGRAVDAWSKAEYWQSRTAGVISHALHVSSPDVRMGRIKTLETELRRFSEPRTDRGREWKLHLELRLSYENQMLEAQGGRAAHVEMIPGGFIAGRQIHKVSKSPATGRVTSVQVKGPRVEGWVYKAHNVPGTDYALHQIETERLPANAYRAPTAEELEKYEAEKKARKAAAPKVETLPFINPTMADAERLQAAWNDAIKLELEARKKKHGWATDYEPALVYPMTQAQYSANSGGTYSSMKPVVLCRGGVEQPQDWHRTTEGAARVKKAGPALCKVRQRTGANYLADRVIVITDKPQKPLPAAMWAEAPAPAEELALK